MSKKWIIMLAVMSLLVLPVMAQNMGNGGNGGNGNSGNGGSGNSGANVYDILVGTPFSFSGIVSSVGIAGDGLIIDGSFTVTGLGPINYWDSLNVEKPVVGDNVSGNGYTVDYDGVLQNILTDITVNGALVELRDSDGLPLWRGTGGGGTGENTWTGGGMGTYTSILEGTPFSINGDIISTGPMDQSGFNGDGLVIATSSGNMTVTGMGSFYYWENLGLTKPVVGDNVSAEGYSVIYDTTTVNILMSITLSDGVKVQLRDPLTGAPLWIRSN